jgi:hyaluronoglucosaminidase
VQENIGLGIIEGFFGPHWTWENRNFMCDFLVQNQSQFYIYAPKQDPYLRKNWTQDHPQDLWANIQRLSKRCDSQKLSFGVGLSPFEIHHQWNASSKENLRKKILKIEDLNSKYLGLFFDDMKGSPDLADKQSEIVEFVRNVTQQSILFCPTYYSDDPILDKVFGVRAEDYLQKIGKHIDDAVMILWTGKKVISTTIASEDLHQIAGILKRKPVIWDNYFANDGPKQCKFIKLKGLTGRTPDALAAASGWAFNLMNQAHLSAVVYKASIEVLKMDKDPNESLRSSLVSFSNDSIASLILKNKNLFLELGLDQSTEHLKSLLQDYITQKNDFPILDEIFNWINGSYNVGSECLTD